MRRLYKNAKFAALLPVFLTGCMSGPTPQASNTQSGNSNAQASSNRQSHPGQQSTDGASGQQGSNMQGMGGMQGMDHSSMGNMKGMEHSSMAGMQGMDHSHGAGHEDSGAGKPGSAAQASRTVNVVALDTMRFDPRTLRVQAGETIRFVVTNKGKLPHEFVIASQQEQREHDEMMQKMPGMKHADGNALSLAPGETKRLVWQFGQSGTVELACHVPGHYPAGMVSKVTVVPQGK